MRRTAILVGSAVLAAAPLLDAGLRYVANGAALAAFSQTVAHIDHLSAKEISFDPWHAALRIDGLAFTSDNLSVRVAKLILAPHASFSGLIAPALAAESAATVAAENIVVESNDATYAIPRIEATGTNLSQSELAGLFDAKSTKPIAERLATLSAAKISISEARVRSKGGAYTGQFVYSGIELTGVDKGLATEGRMTGISATFMSGDSTTAEATCGPAQITDLDIGRNAMVMTQTAQAVEELRLLYSSFVTENCRMSFAQTQTHVDIASISLKDVKGRPLLQSWNSVVDLFKPDEPETDDPDLGEKRRAYLLDVYASYALGGAEAKDVRITSNQDGTVVVASLAKMSLDKFAASKAGEIRFEDLQVAASGAKVKVASMALHGFDLASFAKLAARRADEQIARLPTLDEFVIEGLDVDAADPRADTAHTRFQLAKFTATGNTAADGTPTRLTWTLDHFTAALDDPKMASFAEVAALGYDKLDLSSRLTVSFDQDKEELSIEDISLTGKDMGFVKFSGKFINVSKDLFSQDKAAVEAALYSALVKRVEIRVENAGFFDRYVARAAKQEGKSPDQIKRDYVTSVSLAVPAVLDNGPGAKVIAAALAKFVASPRTFHLVASAPDGLGAADFALLKEPAVLLEKLQVEATANE